MLMPQDESYISKVKVKTKKHHLDKCDYLGIVGKQLIPKLWK
jgi:hypothetical protein